jgi:hypothetical protein
MVLVQRSFSFDPLLWNQGSGHVIGLQWGFQQFGRVGSMKELLEQYVKRVLERSEFCRGNEQQAKASLIAPLFALVGYDMGLNTGQISVRARSLTPVDWAFLICAAFASSWRRNKWALTSKNTPNNSECISVRASRTRNWESTRTERPRTVETTCVKLKKNALQH